jgi:hypothetical protein
VDFELARAMGDAPKTFVRPLLDAVADTVLRYLCYEPTKTHAAEARKASLVQNLNRKAEAYNRLAKGAEAALAEYEAALAAVESIEGVK